MADEEVEVDEQALKLAEEKKKILALGTKGIIFSFSEISRILGRFLMEHLELICSLHYQLFFILIYSIRIFSYVRDIFKKPNKCSIPFFSDEMQVMKELDEDDLQQLLCDIADMDPDNTMLPVGFRQRDQTTKARLIFAVTLKLEQFLTEHIDMKNSQDSAL